MSDADYCECYYEDYSVPEFYHVKDVKARKQFKCEECRGPIFPGEVYQRIVGKWEGSIGTLRTCLLCRELQRWAEISVPCFCSPTGELHERVRAMVKDVAPNVPGFFFEYGRRMVKIRERKRTDSK